MPAMRSRAGRAIVDLSILTAPRRASCNAFVTMKKTTPASAAHLDDTVVLPKNPRVCSHAKTRRVPPTRITDVLDEVGNIKAVKDWPSGLQAAVSSVKVMKRNTTAGDGIQEDVVETKLWDKLAALTLLFRHLGIGSEKVDVTLHDMVRERMAAARDRLAKG